MQLILDTLIEDKYIRIVKNADDPQKSAYAYNKLTWWWISNTVLVNLFNFEG